LSTLCLRVKEFIFLKSRPVFIEIQKFGKAVLGGFPSVILKEFYSGDENI